MLLESAYKELNIVQDFIPRGNLNRPGASLSATSITIHNTDNTDSGANAAAHARYQKGPDAQKRQVSWHFTVDDSAIYQSLPTNEIGWHTATREGNYSSIGIEICMNEGLDKAAAYRRAALLVAVIARIERISVPGSVFQHYDWSGKNCPIVLRSTPTGWSNFLAQIDGISKSIIDPSSGDIRSIGEDNHNFPTGAHLDTMPSAVAAIPPALAGVSAGGGIAWGKSVDAGFRTKVIAIAIKLGCDVNHLMAAMAFETGETFSPSIQNPRSNATGLIQFMPATAISLGTTVDDLVVLDAVSQLDWVEKYLSPFKGRMRSLSDVYMAILYPPAVGKPDGTILFTQGSENYDQNSALDINKDGKVTKGEAASKVQIELDRGFARSNYG